MTQTVMKYAKKNLNGFIVVLGIVFHFWTANKTQLMLKFFRQLRTYIDLLLAQSSGSYQTHIFV